SYRAFIPKQWDSEYKEYERLCKENIGKVVYARPIKDYKGELDISYAIFPISDHINVMIGITRKVPENPKSIHLNSYKNITYMYIVNFQYYTGWSSVGAGGMADYKYYIDNIPSPLDDGFWDKEMAKTRQKALENKEYIGKEYEGELQYSPYHYEYNTLYRQILNFKQKGISQ
ncbi:hypothetical protein CQA53_11765, partial [Helicobacter didelphidarum]